MDKLVEYINRKRLFYYFHYKRPENARFNVYNHIMFLIFSFLFSLELELRCSILLCQIKLAFIRIPLKVLYIPFASIHMLFFKPINILQLGFIVTTRCSLNCKYCGDWISYVKDRKDIDLDSLFSDIDAISNIAHTVYNFDISGGEPLIRKDIAEIVNYASEKKNFLNIRIITNATIIPSDSILSKIRKDKLIFKISNYGPLSAKLKELTMTLDRFKIKYIIPPMDSWVDLGPPVFRNYTLDQSRLNFLACEKRNATNLFDGKIYPCANVHIGMLIGAIPDCANDYVKVRDVKNLKMTRQQIRKLLHREGYTACHYCSGCSAEHPTISPAEQLPVNTYIDYKTGQIKPRGND